MKTNAENRKITTKIKIVKIERRKKKKKKTTFISVTQIKSMYLVS